MKKILLPSLFIGTIFCGANAQSNKAFAITAETKGNYAWTVVRQIDLSNGDVVKTVFTPSENKAVSYEGVAGRMAPANPQSLVPTGTGVAAAAYDSKHNRLYFSQMFGNELRYFDLNSSETKVVINSDINYSTGPRNDESNVVTRMTFASDGNGYALTNDGNQLLRFTTDEKPVITNLGALLDAKSNSGIGVHNQCTSWGGDMIGDVYGNLYLFTYRNNVFKINIQTRVAEFIGTIKGIPATFTTNGAVVDAKGDVFVSSATSTDNYYRVNLSTLEATVVPKSEATVYNASDLANENLAYQNDAIKLIDKSEVIGNAAVSIYPNPAINKTFSVQFEKVAVGSYVVELSDANGRKVLSKTVVVNGVQTQQINLPKGTATGLYLIKVTSANGKAVYDSKVVVQ
jgi:hypothetical protein